MNIAVDVTPISDYKFSGHKTRGVGSYIASLRDNLERYDKNNSYTFFSRGEKLPKNTNLIYVPYFELFFLTLPLFKKRKTIVMVHDLIPLIFPSDFPVGVKGYVKWQIQKIALKNTDAIITNSNSSKNDIVRLLGISQNKISVVHLAASKEFEQKKYTEKEIDAFSKKYNLPKEFVLYVGDATANKNLPRLIESVKQAKVPLVIVGKTLAEENFDKNPWNRDLKNTIEEIKNDPLITRVGFVDTNELAVFYNLATCLVMPSLYEGFGLPVLEAMSCGCPVITTKEGGIPEVTEDSAFIVDPHNVQSITKGVKEVFNSTKLQEDLSKKGLAQAKKFSWEKTILETVNVFTKVFK